MTQTNEPILQEDIDFGLLEDARKALKWSMERTAREANLAEGTTKNILTGKTGNPGSANLRQLCDALNVPIEKVVRSIRKTEIENKGIRMDDASILALKEIYEKQLLNVKETNEAHIHNIRTHYEQHHQDLVENFEKRLSDKRELIESYKEHIKALEKECRISKIAIWICVIVFIAVLIAEVMNPSLGWFRFNIS